jgi:hypothetical protein
MGEGREAGEASWGGGACASRAIAACRLGFTSILTGGGAGAGGWRAGGAGLGRLRMVTTGIKFVTASASDYRQNSAMCAAKRPADLLSVRFVWLAFHRGRG